MFWCFERNVAQKLSDVHENLSLNIFVIGYCKDLPPVRGRAITQSIKTS